MKKEYLLPQIKVNYEASEKLCNVLDIFSDWNMLPINPEGEADQDEF